MPMLTHGGVVWINPAGEDRSLLATYWITVEWALGGSTFLLTFFTGKSVLDTESGQRFPFITDLETILVYHEQLDFGSSFYKTRGDIARPAA